MLCQYRDALGKVGEGVHSYRIGGIAVVDVFLTLVAAYLIHLAIPHSSYWTVLFWLFIAGIALHRLFCVRTTVDRLLFS